MSQRGPSPLQTGAREQMVRTQGSGQGSTGGYGIHFGDPLAPAQPMPADSARNAPPTRMSGKSQMSNVSYDRMQEGYGTSYSGGGTENATPPRRTLRRMYEDQSHYQKDEFLYGLEPAPSAWKPEASTRNTLFHNGFYRGIVSGQDAQRKNHEQDREARSEWRSEPRNHRLTDLVCACFVFLFPIFFLVFLLLRSEPRHTRLSDLVYSCVLFCFSCLRVFVPFRMHHACTCVRIR